MLTEDDSYMIVLMSTNHAGSRVSSLKTTFNYPNTISAAISDPYPCPFGICSYQSWTTFISSTDRRNIVDWCEGTFLSEFTAYVQEYNNDIYSWGTCQHEVYDFNDLDCIADIKFARCSLASSNNGPTSYSTHLTFTSSTWMCT